MKGFIEITGNSGKPRLINIRYIEEVAELDDGACEIYIHADAYLRIMVHLPYNRVVEMIKEAVE